MVTSALLSSRASVPVMVGQAWQARKCGKCRAQFLLRSHDGFMQKLEDLFERFDCPMIGSFGYFADADEVQEFLSYRMERDEEGFIELLLHFEKELDSIIC